MREKSLPENLLPLRCCETVGRRGAPQCTWQRGTLTVEAAIVLPLMACFFAFILFYFRIMQVQLSVQNALEETGRNLAILSVKELEESEAEPPYLVAAKALLYLALKDDEVVEEYVTGGAIGVGLLASEFDGDYILLKANYVMKFPVELLGKKTFLINQKTSFRKWTGWHAASEEDEDAIVYVTKYGMVYHMRTSCPYLDLSIQTVLESEAKQKRNANEERYMACESCDGKKGTQGVVYITNYGNRYHYDIGCSGLKRIIYQKAMSEVGGMSACPKCWK